MGGTDPGTGRVTSNQAPLKRKRTMPFITISNPPKYPLTRHEKEWLKARQDRELRHGHFSCIYCEHFISQCDPYTGHCDGTISDCMFEVIKRHLQDAAVFEALVAAKAVKLKADALPCYPNKLCPYKAQQIGSCHACYLRHARLLAEATMERSGHND